MPRTANEFRLPKTTYTAYVRTGSFRGGEILVNASTYREKAPTRQQLAEQMARFNHQRRPEFHATGILVVKERVDEWPTAPPTPEELASALARINEAEGATPHRPAAPEGEHHA